MSRVSKGGVVKMPAPVMGVDWSVARDEVEYPYTPCSLDWIANGNTVKIRDRHDELANTSGFTDLASFDAESTILSNMPSGGSPGIYEYQPLTETATRIHTSNLPFGGHCNYQNRVFLATSAGAASWDGTTFNSTAFTGASGGTLKAGCCIYRDRYFHVQGSNLFWSPTSGGLSGALNTFALASYYSAGDFIACVPITITDSSSLAEYLLLMTEGGDIVVFTGDFPGSANWQLVSRVKLPCQQLGYNGVVPYSGDAYIYTGFPSAVLSARTLIQSGRLEAERTGPLSKQLNFIKEAFSTAIFSVTAFPAQNALLVQVFMSTPFNSLLFGFTPAAQAANWLFVDINSGAVSPFSYPAFSRSLDTTAPISNKTIAHTDGYVYTVSKDSGTLWKLFDSTFTNSEEDFNTFLQFPYSDLGLPDTIKRIEMAYPVLARYGGYVEAKLAVDYDFDRNLVTTFDSKTGAAVASTQVNERLIVPMRGAASEVSVALINKRRPRLSCQSISLQFEEGGPY